MLVLMFTKIKSLTIIMIIRAAIMKMIMIKC